MMISHARKTTSDTITKSAANTQKSIGSKSALILLITVTPYPLLSANIRARFL